MGKKRRNQRQWHDSPAAVIGGMFLLSVLVRYFLSYYTSAGPTVYIDEGLYVNIARSLAAQGEVMYRAQPVSYVYLLYPISILPVFFLPASVNIYRVLQLWNAVMMSTMVFPVYLLCKQLKIEKKQAYTVSAATLLLPEFVMTSHLVAESLIYPLMAWIFLLAWLALAQKEKAWRWCTLGIVSGLAYFAKPACVVFGACFCVVMLFVSIKKREGRQVLKVLLGAAMMAATIIAGYLLYGALFDRASVLNLYEKQIPKLDVENILIMLQGVLFHVFAFAVSGGSALLLLPCIGMKKQTETQREYFAAMLLSVLVQAISIGIMIVPYEYTGTWGNAPTHLRYMMYCFPVMLIWLCLPEMEGVRAGKKGMALMWGLTALFVFPSAFSCFTEAGAFGSPALNIFNAERAGRIPGILCICILTLVNVLLLKRLQKTGFVKKVKKTALTVVLAFLVANGIMVYANQKSIDRDFEKEAAAIAQEIAGEDVVVCTNNLYDDFRGYQLDAHLHRPAQMVVNNNMLLDAVETGGVYRPFEPVVQAPNTGSLPTVQTDLILFDVTTADYVEFTEYVQLRKSPGGLYTLARITDGKPYLKTAIASMDGYTLSVYDQGSLLVFDEEILAQGEVTLHIQMRARRGAAQVTFSCEGQSKTVDVGAQPQEYRVTLPVKKCAFFHFTIDGSDDIIISSYYTE